MQHDRHAIAAEYHVLFDKVGTHGMCQGLRGQGVLGQVAAGAPVRDDQGRAGLDCAAHLAAGSGATGEHHGDGDPCRTAHRCLQHRERFPGVRGVISSPAS